MERLKLHPVIDPATGVRPTIDGHRYDRAISDLVRRVTERQGEKQALAKVIGIAPQSLSHGLLDPSRERYRSWSAREVGIMAAHYGVTANAFYYHDDPERQALIERLHQRGIAPRPSPAVRAPRS